MNCPVCSSKMKVRYYNDSFECTCAAYIKNKYTIHYHKLVINGLVSESIIIDEKYYVCTYINDNCTDVYLLGDSQHILHFLKYPLDNYDYIRDKIKKYILFS